MSLYCSYDLNICGWLSVWWLVTINDGWNLSEKVPSAVNNSSLQILHMSYRASHRNTLSYHKCSLHPWVFSLWVFQCLHCPLFRPHYTPNPYLFHQTNVTQTKVYRLWKKHRNEFNENEIWESILPFISLGGGGMLLRSTCCPACTAPITWSNCWKWKLKTQK